MRQTRAAIAAAAIAVATVATAGAATAAITLDYRATETGSTAVDRSGYGNDGTLHHVTRSGGQYVFQWDEGDPHAFIRTTDDDDTLDPGRRPFSYTAQVMIPPNATWQKANEMNVMRRSTVEIPGGGYKMEVHRNPNSGNVAVQCSMHDGNGGNAVLQNNGSGGTVLNDGTWHTLTCARAGGTISLTIDGTTATKPTDGLGAIRSPQPLYIGVKAPDVGGYNQQFEGRMDNIRITVQRVA